MHAMLVVMGLPLPLLTAVVTMALFWHDLVMSVPCLVLMLLQILKWFISWQYKFESRLLGWPVVFLGLWVTSLTQSFIHQTSTKKGALQACRALLFINTFVQGLQLFAYLFCEWFPFNFYRRTYNWLSRREKIIFWVASLLLVWVDPKLGREHGAIERKPYSRALWDMGRIAAKGFTGSAIAAVAISMIPLLELHSRNRR